MNDASDRLDDLAPLRILYVHHLAMLRKVSCWNREHTGILPSPAYSSANALICGASAFLFASQRFRIAIAACRHKEVSVNADTTYPITDKRRSEDPEGWHANQVA